MPRPKKTVGPTSLRKHHARESDAAPLWSATPRELSGMAGRIATRIEERLVHGEYHFGEAISIFEIAEEFGSSRQPVAAAVNHLRACGYLEVIPQVGCRVVERSPPEILDFYRMYGKVEGVIAGFAAQRYQGVEGTQLKALARQVEATSLVTLEERRAHAASVWAYHVQLSRMARTSTVTSHVDSLRRLSMFYLWQGNPEVRASSLKLMISMRIGIAEAVMARDVEAAERLMEAHIEEKPRRALKL